MTIAKTLESSTNAPAPPVPKLRHGERLSREEFERRYENMPDVKAELLDGVVYVAPPRVTLDHGRANGAMIGWLGYFCAFTRGIESCIRVTTRLSKTSEVQPDTCLRILETNGGTSHIDAYRYIAGSPELLGEIANSSKSYDRTMKMPIYKRDGIREFILWRVEDNAIDWFILRNDDYELLVADAAGIIRSETFPGLWLDVDAMLRRDGVQVLKVLQQGIASPEHAEFVERLRINAAKQ